MSGRQITVPCERITLRTAELHRPGSSVAHLGHVKTGKTLASDLPHNARGRIKVPGTSCFYFLAGKMSALRLVPSFLSRKVYEPFPDNHRAPRGGVPWCSHEQLDGYSNVRVWVSVIPVLATGQCDGEHLSEKLVISQSFLSVDLMNRVHWDLSISVFGASLRGLMEFYYTILLSSPQG